MAGNLLGEPFKSYVNDQIKIRQKVHGKRNRTTQELQYLNTRTTWIKLASAVSVEQKRLDLLKNQNDRGNPLLDNIHKGQDLAIKYVLFNGLTRMGSTTMSQKEFEEDGKTVIKDVATNTFSQQQRAGVGGSNGAYGVGGTDFGYSPMPGIIDMDFKCLNRGSIKKASLNIKAHNRNQFDIIDTLYLRLGYSVFLEWGYDKYIDNNGNLQQMGDTLIDGPFWQDNFSKSDYSKWLPEIENKRNETNGNYEGAFGVISNFSWTFEDDGTYNIKLEIINLGDVIESLKVNLPIVGSGAENPYLSAKLAALQNKSESGKDVAQGEFYSSLYPGLEAALNEWLTGKKGVPPKVELPFNTSISALEFKVDDSSLPEYINPNGLEDKDFEVSLDLLKSSINSALQSYYGNPLGKGNLFNDQWQNTYEKESLKLQGKAKSVVDEGFLPPSYGRYWYFPYPNIIKGKTLTTFVKWGQKTINARGSVVVTYWLNSNWVSRYNSLNNSLKWEMLLNNKIPANYSGPFSVDLKEDIYEGEVITKENLNYSPEINDLLKGVYEYFKNRGKAKSLPQSKKQKALSNLVKEIDEGPEKVFFDSLAEQTKQDRINKNKNRIFRFFYDIRQQGASTLVQQSSTTFLAIDEQYLNYGYSKKKILSFFKSLNKENRGTSSLEEVLNGETFKKSTIKLSILNSDKLGDGIQFDRKLIRKQSIIAELQKPNPNREYVDGTKIKTSETEMAIARYNYADVNNQYYIRLGFFLDWINENVIPKIDSTDQGKPLMEIDTDTDINICYVIDNVLSLNPKKCIANNEYFTQGLKNSEDPNTSVKTRIFGGLNKFVIKSINGDDIFWGQIMNVYFSFNRLEEIFSDTNEKNEVSLYKTLKSICNDINECFGNINNIEPIIDENNVVKFIDQTSIPNLDIIAKELQLPDFNPPQEATLEIFGYNTDKNTSNFVRKVGLTTEISKNYATMITIGATANGSIPGAEATAFSRWNIGLKDRFKNNIFDSKEQNYNMNSPITSSISQTTLSSYANFINSNTYEIMGLNSDEPKTFNNDFIELNTEVAENYYKLYQAETSIKEENPIESSIGFLPFNLKLDLDGIGGIKIYNRVKVNTSFLPSNYPETLEFIITGVNHRLSDNDWITSLETTATSTNAQTKRKK